MGKILILSLLLLNGCVTAPALSQQEIESQIKEMSDTEIYTQLSTWNTSIYNAPQNRNKLRIEIVRRHPEWKEFGQNVLNQKLALGMTAEQVLAMWGYPLRSNRWVGQYGTTKQWHYGWQTNDTTVFLDNDKVTNWHNSSGY